MDTGLRVTSCDTDETLAVAAGLFNHYRHHYGESDGEARARDWLSEMVRTRQLMVYAAFMTSGPDDAPVGLATAHETPASLALGRFWQVRDLYVLPEARRRGVAGALVGAVRDAAVAAGATRLSLVTEPDNTAALGLYRGFGFRRVEGLTSLSLDLAPRTAT
ncbi:GNAT family N-acetyltransferase [Nocardioides lacusdianchii]|uniref:GNAT family N-acetyltransferase n=1 Tax=Nocardioides lacusdianchii TaxID=2783664 RepID=UPI001CCC1FEA|nr:GNAT family N-acetyltransferase [Nocardioides lacusdianchii]